MTSPTEAALDAHIAAVERDRVGCLDCEIGEPHCCQVADAEYRAALKARDEAQAVIDEMERRMEHA